MTGAPWRFETIAVPQRLDGWRVIAAAKLPATATHNDLFTVVVEANPGPGYNFYAEVRWSPRDGFTPVGAARLLTYGVAMFLFGTVVSAMVDDLGERYRPDL